MEGRLGLTRSLMRGVMNQAKSDIKRIVFTEGDHPTVVKAAAECIRERICSPILLGRESTIEEIQVDKVVFQL